LKQVTLIAAEDTRQTRILLDHYQIHTPLLSYHEHNKAERQAQLLAHLADADLALVSDAGTPVISDPGHELVQAALAAGHTVSPIPGPAAPIAALVASGLSADRFTFVGYLPRKAVERGALLEELAREPHTVVAFEAPHRLVATLADLEQVFGAERNVAVCRELTKLHEQVVRGALAQVRAHFESETPRGEITLVLEGNRGAVRWTPSQVSQALERHLAAGESPSQAARAVAAEAGWPRREVYQLTLQQDQDESQAQE
jgi:16S rRNA (cytidine1402-2'-O)-methyltransferase